ncbi:HYR domain-containing protein [Ulvibacter antarcticus]|uniref:Putative secreted protein (Por secretion system target) n=1 Tax=Ulvibacter antarcticus TaxID=442714 RepID=A0A3L9YAB4_9FLAO|nr:HYR domain-containing protein [Ulvibacter antarcticus]RMA57656.1 putative secreted protein (Por secretion system target) [Ulvibacter antarcticus]
MKTCITPIGNRHIRFLSNYRKAVNRLIGITVLILFMFINPLVFGQESKNLTKEDLIGKTVNELTSLGILGSSNVESRSNPIGQQTMQYRTDCTDALIPRDASYTAVSRNDDGFTGPITIPFDFAFCSTTYNTVWVNTNGNLTFTQGLSIYNAQGFPYTVPMVAAFWADVDTRNCPGQIYYKILPDHMIVTWDEVTYFPANNCPVTNTFQIIISDGNAPIVGVGNNLQFRYGDMNWTTGLASGGGPFGGTPATVGWNSGNNTNFEQVGRFNEDSAAYDGPFGANDGVHFLDNNCFSFATQGVGPSITCNDITRSLDATGNVSITASEVAVAQDGCSGATITLSDYDFGCFDIGANIITATATSGIGQTASCNLTVTIVDDLAPSLSCPTDMTLNNDPGDCGAIFTYNITASDNCGFTLTQTQGLASGSTFPLGTTTNTFIVTDDSGLSNSCTFNITVIDTELPTIMCPADISVANDEGECSAIVEYDFPVVSDNCSGTPVNSVLVNGSFETGDYSGWTIDSGSSSCGIFGIMSDGQTLSSGDPIYNYSSNSTQSVTFSQGLPITFNTTDGDKMMAFFQNCGPFAHKLYQDVIMPAGASQLCYDLEYNNFAGSFSTNQYFAVEIRDSGTDALLETLFITNPGDALNVPMTQYCFDTSAYAGQAIRVQMINSQIDVNPLTIFIDNIALGSDLELMQTAGLASGSEFPLGTTTNTFVVTDGSGNSETCSFDVTVNDTEAPTIMCPADISVANDEGECSAVIEYDLPIVSDNCSGTIIGNVLENGSFETGDYSSWNIVSGSPSCGIWGIMDDGQTLSSGDPIYNYANNTTQAVTFPQGLPITFNTTDGDKMMAFFQNCGPFAHKLYQDVIMPVGTSQLCYDLEYNNFAGSFSTNQYFAVEIRDSGTDALLETLFITNPGDALNVPMTQYCFDTSAYSGQAIRVQMINSQIDVNPLTIFIDNIVLGSELSLVQTAGFASGDAFPVGTTINTFVVTDASGNSNTCSFDVIVEDTELPLAVCQNISVDLDAMGVATITADDIDDGSSDNCEIDTITVSQTEFGCDDIGSNTVTLTVTDIYGNESECMAVVTVNGIIPEVEITQSELPEFCQGAFLILTANSDDAISYMWDTGEMTSSIEVMADGVYTVTVTSATNCTATASYEVIGFDPTILLSSYIMIAEKEVHLHNDSDVLSGAIGVTDNKGKVKIHDNTHVVDFVKADDIDVHSNSSVGAAIYAPAVVTLPPFLFNTLSDNSSPDVTVNNNQSVTLTGSVYDKVEIKDGATVLFTSPDIYIDDLKTKKDITIEFAGCANLYLNKDLKLEKNSIFNSAGNYVVVYIDKKLHVKEGSNVTGHFYSYDKDIEVKGKDDNPTYMTGSFIGEKIKGDKNVTWQIDPYCAPCANSIVVRGEHANTTEGSEFDYSSISIYPNPGRNYVMLSNPHGLDLQTVTVYDLTGRLLQSVDLTDMEAEKSVDISQLSSATYLLVIKGAQGEITKQLIKE